MPTGLRKFIAHSPVRHVAKGQIVVYAGDVTVEVYLIKQGTIKLHTLNEQGREKVLHLLSPGTTLPFSFFSGRDVATRWYYTTLTDCDLRILSRDKLTRLLEGDGKATLHLVNHFSEQVHEVIVRLDSLGKTTTPERLIAVLRYLIACHGAPAPGRGWFRIPFPITHQLLADMVGSSRESVAGAIKELQERTIVRKPQFSTLEINSDNLNAYRRNPATRQ